MKKNKGFTLIELMIVIAIIAIIAAIAIPNLMQSRIRANEATAVSAIKAYAAAQVTWQVGRQSRQGGNSSSGNNGYASNYRNLYYGIPVGSTAGVLQLISQVNADAATNASDNDATTGTVTGAALVGPSQGYHFQSPTSLPATPGINWYDSQFAQIAVPANSTSTGTNAYYVGIQGTVWMRGLPAGADVAGSITVCGTAALSPVTVPPPTDWTTL